MLLCCCFGVFNLWWLVLRLVVLSLLGVVGLIGWFWWFGSSCLGWLLLVRWVLRLLWRIVNLMVWVVLLAELLNFGCDLWV